MTFSGTPVKALAILGTGSDVGKTLIVAGICRLLSRRGVWVAPFKAQNMALNSFVTIDGGEIGRAQALQAQACGIEPTVDMNPILLKPESDSRSQVVVRGKVYEALDALAYFERKGPIFKIVQACYARLAAEYECVVIEGAGSAAEINLRDRDMVNWPVVELADAAVVLVADIDRGGVFAQIIGTLDLLEPHERQRVHGVIVNKFRGDRSLFEDGVSMLEARTGLPVLGVVPYLRDLRLDQEDSLDLAHFRSVQFKPGLTNVAVVLLPRMSNFTEAEIEYLGTVGLGRIATVADALGALLRARPDVVFLDINMPRMNGIEVLKDIKRIDASIAVIMVTANEQITLAAEALTAGAFAYVPKPFDFRYLDHMVAAIFDQATTRAADTLDGAVDFQNIFTAR
jgi:adenosylcobyric acid synthase